MGSSIPVHHELDSLLSRLGDQIRECRTRVDDGSRDEEQTLRSLKLFTDSVGVLDISLSCPDDCAGCAGCAPHWFCGSSGKMSNISVDLVADCLHDEVQLVARYLLMLLVERGGLDVAPHFPVDEKRPVPEGSLGSESEEEESSGRPGPQAAGEATGWPAEEAAPEPPDPEDADGVARSGLGWGWDDHDLLHDVDDDDDEGDDEEDVSEEYYDFHESPPDVAVDLMSLSRYEPGYLVKLKTDLLAPQLLRRVRKLTKLQCEHDPDWVLQLLYDASPHLEELQLHTPARPHLEVVESMPRLTHLDVEYYALYDPRAKAAQVAAAAAAAAAAAEAAAGPGDDGRGREGRAAADGQAGVALGVASPWPCWPRSDAPPKEDSYDYVFRRPPASHRGLRWLRVKDLSYRTTFSLLRAHRRTLEEVWLAVGTWSPQPGPDTSVIAKKASLPGSSADDAGAEADESVASAPATAPRDEVWPASCADLHVHLSRVGPLPRLRRLVLYRWMNIHDPISCLRQVMAVRDALPGVAVQCLDCDGQH